ncbi:hypothetical protein HO133_009301 [Letharia lupina]|uniref:Uncharacterized protein n=1 Tax=Letharia lupina TaxID=560253 RepID=A0A8H6CN34_9LECA|nr:uncharacterized protein HO133_009301 [Letharia lupina]KAF6226435.1 hypothetical protein HO133_009301 [Letharia lupina]
MDIGHESTAKAATVSEDQEPFKHQLLRERGRSNSPVVVYDCDQKTVQVRSKKNVESEDNYQKVKLPARSKQVTLFVDEETQSKLTTRSTGRDGQSNVLLAQLYLDRLGPYGQIFRFLGLLSTLYVMNAGPLSETSSQTIV